MQPEREQELKKARQNYYIMATFTVILSAITLSILIAVLKRVDYNWGELHFADVGDLLFFSAIIALFALYSYIFRKKYLALKEEAA